MTNANELLERLRQDGAERFAATALARDHGAVTRRVRRDRAVRAGLVGATGAVAAAGIAVAATHIGSAVAPPATTGTAAPSPTASAAVATVSVGRQERIENVAADLAAAMGVTRDDAMAALIDALPPQASGNPEGWVVAGDYGFDANTNVQAAAVQMTDVMVRHLESAGVPSDQWLDTVIIASIVQQEAPARPSDQSGVARVILNRLDAGMKLQLESPLAYALNADTRSISDDGWAVDTPYNTYLHQGLPPGAIGAPTMEALDAALNPTVADWLYFLRTPDGNVLLFSTYTEFAEAVDQYNPGTGASD